MSGLDNIRLNDYGRVVSFTAQMTGYVLQGATISRADSARSQA